MKISKLFHWLYGLVMLLPIFAIGVTCGYAMFNKNAYQSYADYQNEEIVNVSLNEQLQSGVTYQVNINSLTFSNGYEYYVLDGQTNIRELYTPNENYIVDRINFIYEGQRLRIQWFSTTNTQYNKFISSISDYTTPIWFVSNGNNTYGASSTYYSLTTLTYTNGKLSDVFYYSVDKVTQSNLFNWAYDSFLVAPFTYIVSLFSMPSNSPVVMLMSYWLAISIIWLVFDLVMYVPLLVHRWLDKGGIE